MTGAQTIAPLCFTNCQRDGPFGSRIKYVRTQHGEAGKLSASPTGNSRQNRWKVKKESVNSEESCVAAIQGSRTDSSHGLFSHCPLFDLHCSLN